MNADNSAEILTLEESDIIKGRWWKGWGALTLIIPVVTINIIVIFIIFVFSWYKLEYVYILGQRTGKKLEGEVQGHFTKVVRRTVIPITNAGINPDNQHFFSQAVNKSVGKQAWNLGPS